MTRRAAAGAAPVRAGARNARRGLRIQTIHGFAQTLLASFPAEAGINPGFRPIEGRAEAELVRRTLAALLADAEASGDQRLIAMCRRLACGSVRRGAGLSETCARAEEMIDALGDPAAFEATLLERGRDRRADVRGGMAARLADDEIDVRRSRTDRGQSRLGHRNRQDDRRQSDAFLCGGDADDRLAMLDEVGKESGDREGRTVQRQPGQTIHPEYAELLGEFAHWLVELRRAPRRCSPRRRLRAFARARRSRAPMPRQARRRGRRLRRPDPLDPAAARHRRGWANGCASSSTSAPTMSWSTRRRTPMPTNGRSSTPSRPNISPGRTERAGGPCSWSATTSRRSSVSRGPIRGNFEHFARPSRARRLPLRRRSTARLGARIPRPVDRRQLPFVAAVLQVVDALIDEVGHEAMGCPRRPTATSAIPSRPGEVELWPASRPPTRTVTTREGEEGWVAEPVRLYADALARQIKAGSTTRRCGEHRTAAVRRRHPGPRAQPRRTRQPDRRPALRPWRAGGGDRPAPSPKPLAVKDLLAAIGFAVQPHDD